MTFPASRALRHWLVPPSGRFALSEVDTASTTGARGKKKETEALSQVLRDRLFDLQAALFAEGKHSLLLVLQAMDCGGKDGTVKKVAGTMNPQGLRIVAFGKPTEEELSHDFLWRINQALPAAGYLGVFNRSQYEDVLVVRVHGLVPDLVEERLGQKVAAK